MTDHKTVSSEFKKEQAKGATCAVEKALSSVKSDFDNPLKDFELLKKKVDAAIAAERKNAPDKKRLKQLDKLAKRLEEARTARINVPLIIDKPN
ncbi:MAG: hypothetical protein AAFR79_09950 [Pseudomonadota bacterium]